MEKLFTRLFSEKDQEYFSDVFNLSLEFIKELQENGRSADSKLKLNYIEYINLFYSHGLPTNKKETKFKDTKSKRLKFLVKIKVQIGRNPTSDDFRKMFPIKVSKSFYRRINKDIQNLLLAN